MIKLIFTLIASLTIGASAFGQTITYENFNEVIPFLQKEDFKGAYEKTSQLLSTTTDDGSDLYGIVTYMNIFSAANMIILDQMTYEEFEKVTKKFVGQYVVMPGHPYLDSSKVGYNSIQFKKNDKGDFEGMVVTSNSSRTSMLCFEYFDFKDKITPTDFIDKNVRCGGILKSIEINPNKSKLWVSKLHISEAFARVMEPR